MKKDKMITVGYIALGLLETKLRAMDGHDFFGDNILAYNKHVGVICTRWSYFLLKEKWKKVYILARYDTEYKMRDAMRSITDEDLKTLQRVLG